MSRTFLLIAATVALNAVFLQTAARAEPWKGRFTSVSTMQSSGAQFGRGQHVTTRHGMVARPFPRGASRTVWPGRRHGAIGHSAQFNRMKSTTGRLDTPLQAESQLANPSRPPETIDTIIGGARIRF
jgi:hypothetical protein